MCIVVFTGIWIIAPNEYDDRTATTGSAKQYTGSAINRIVKKVLSKLDYQSDSLYTLYRNDEGEVSDIQYDSYH